jgi:hypothetical protein
MLCRTRKPNTGDGFMSYACLRKGASLAIVSGLSLVASVCLPVPAALGGPPASCLQGANGGIHGIVDANDGAQEGNTKGIKADVRTYPASGTECLRVSSLQAEKLAPGMSPGEFEFGWYVGWDKGSNSYTGAGACSVSGVYNGVGPKLFVVWQPIGGTFHCRNFSNVAGAQWVNMQIEDENEDGTWRAAVTGSGTLEQRFVNFSRATVFTNSERFNTSDPQHGNFNVLQKELNGINTWGTFSAPEDYQDNEDLHYNCFRAYNHVEVVYYWDNDC